MPFSPTLVRGPSARSRPRPRRPGPSRSSSRRKADTLAQDPQIVWKNISSTATLTSAGGPDATASHGPKVIPPSATFDTARYGDRPFPVVPVDYYDRKHDADPHAATPLADKINSPSVAGSTFNLYQEMSYGQLFPHGDGALGGHRRRAGWSYGPGFDFTDAGAGRDLPRRDLRRPAGRRRRLPGADPRRLVPAARAPPTTTATTQTARRSSAR